MNFKSVLTSLFILSFFIANNTFGAQYVKAFMDYANPKIESTAKIVGSAIKSASETAQPMIEKMYEQSKPYLTKRNALGLSAIVAGSALAYKYLKTKNQKPNNIQQKSDLITLGFVSNFTSLQLKAYSYFNVNETIAVVKNAWKSHLGFVNIDNKNIKMFFGKQELEDDKTVGSYIKENNSILYVFIHSDENLDITIQLTPKTLLVTQKPKLPYYVQNFLKFTGQPITPNQNSKIEKMKTGKKALSSSLATISKVREAPKINQLILEADKECSELVTTN